MYTYTYDITLKFITKDKSFIPTNSLKTVVKRFNYFTDFHPIWEISALVNLRYLDPIRLNRDRIYAILNITRKRRSMTSGEKDVEFDTIDEENILTHTFLPFFTDDSFSNIARQEDITPDDESNGTSSQSGEMMYGMMHEIKVALYSIDGVNMNKPLIGFNATEADVGTAIKFAISVAQKNASQKPKVIIDAPENEEKYTWLNVPGLNLTNPLKFHQARYGVYKSGINGFYDPPYLYVLNRFNTKHDYEKDTTSKVLFEDFVSNPINQGLPVPVQKLKDGSMKYRIATLPSKKNQDTYLSELLGNELIYSNYTLSTSGYKFENGEVSEVKKPFEVIRSESIKHAKSVQKQVVDYDELNNTINQESIIKAMNLGTMITLQSVQGLDLDAVRPNVTATLKIKDDENKDAEFSGIYQFISGNLIFTRQNHQTDEFSCEARDLVMLKIDE